jgi:hypothetical protein
MPSHRRRIFGIISGLLITLAGVAFLLPVKDTWVRLSGAVIAGGSRTQSYTDKPLRILSVEGRRWVAWNKLEGGSAYHALIIFPKVELKDTGYAGGGDGFTDTRTERWQVWNGQPDTSVGEEVELSVTYDALWRTVTVNSQTYHLAGGNMFIIRFDGQHRPAVTQLNMTLDQEAGIDDVIGAFKSKLRGDEMAQQL